MKNALTLSLVIPVYNEQRYIKDCLESIKAQTVKPLEVFVVDNNSTDISVEIAMQYGFVKILHEQKQHQAYAQAQAFDKAKGDILGRIDADTILPPDWIKKVLDAFDNPETSAITGQADPYDIPLKKIGIAIFSFYHTKLTYLFNRKIMLWGSNMAFRAKYWAEVKRNMLITDNLWEDYEMSYWLDKLGKVRQVPNLAVGCSFRTAHKGFFNQIVYQYRAIRVFRRHNSLLKTVVYFFAWYTMIPLFILAMIDKYLLQGRRKIAN